MKIECESEEAVYGVWNYLKKEIDKKGYVTLGEVKNMTVDTYRYLEDEEYGWIELLDFPTIMCDFGGTYWLLELPSPYRIPNKIYKKQRFQRRGFRLDPIKDSVSREDILHKAKECVCGKREQDYGIPEDNFNRIAELWSGYTGHTYSDVDVAMMMSLLKIARIKTGTATEDSFVDLAGYAACGGEISANKKESK